MDEEYEIFFNANRKYGKKYVISGLIVWILCHKSHYIFYPKSAQAAQVLYGQNSNKDFATLPS